MSSPIYTGITAARGDIHHFASLIETTDNKLLFQENVSYGAAARLTQSTSAANYQVGTNLLGAQPKRNNIR